MVQKKVFLSEKLAKKLEKEAKKQGLSFSSYARVLIMKAYGNE